MRPAKTHRSCVCTARLSLALTVLLTAAAVGCVPTTNPRGGGLRYILKEPQSQRQFHLYLPAGYDRRKPWPLVLALHGLKPFDWPVWQLQEWEEMADKHGLIIIAPDLTTSDLSVELRLGKITRRLQKDEQTVIDILDFVLARTAGDRRRVLLTGWSSAGILVHYIANHYSERFSGVFVRSGSFNQDILSEENTRTMAAANFPVEIFYAENDFLHSKRGSQKAIEWYESAGVNLEVTVMPQAVPFPGFGHLRYPEMAAEFFLRSTSLVAEPYVVVSNESGPAPLAVGCSLCLPHQVEGEKMEYFWTLDGEPLARTPEAFTTISTPGLHKIEVVATNGQGKSVTASREVTVLPPGTVP